MTRAHHPVDHHRAGTPDQEGAVSILAALGTVIALLAAVLAIDIGAHVLGQRDIQGAVDLAALDAVTALAADGDPALLADQYARDSLARNGGWSARDGRDVTTQVGRFDEATRTFTPTAVDPNAVLVTATSQLQRLTGILPGADTITHTAVADLLQLSSISIGTHVASLDSSRSAVLSQVMSRLFAGPVTVDAVGWQGLADARVPLRTLMTSFNVGSIDQLLDLQVTARDLLRASASGLTASGDPLDADAATRLGTIAASIDNQSTFRLGDLIVRQGVPGAVADASVDAFSLVTGSAMIINAANVVDLGIDLSGVPGVTSGSLTMAVVEPPQIAIGRPGLGPDGEYRTVARTAQVRFGADLVLDPLGDYAGIGVGSMSLPLAIDAGRGSAALTAVGCSPDETTSWARNLVETTAAGIAYGATADATLLTPTTEVVAGVRSPLVELSARTLLGGEVPIAEVTAAGAIQVPGANETVQLHGPFVSRARIGGNAPLAGLPVGGVGLARVLAHLDLQTTLLGVAPSLTVSYSLDGDGGTVSLTDDVLAPALADAGAVVDRVDQQVVGTITDVLGVATLGDADTAAIDVSCGGRRLVQ